jgi:hypothetical protein
MQSASRRAVLQGGGAIAATALVVAAPKAVGATGPSELAALINRYWAQVDAWNAIEDKTDEEFHADTPFDATLEQMVDVPARTADDAVAAIDWILKEGKEDTSIGFDRDSDMLFDRIAVSLMDAVRGYVVATGRMA